MTMTAANADLQSSLQQTLTDFGPSVRPSLVAAQQQKSLRNMKKQQQLLVGENSSKTDGRTQDDKTFDLESIQSLVAALSFSPTVDKENAAPTTSSSKRNQQFTFETPPKLTPPLWVLQRTSTGTGTPRNQPKTPSTIGTISTLGEENSSPMNDFDNTSSSPVSRGVTAASTSENIIVGSLPTPTLRTSSSHRADAVAMAYPLSLPLEAMRPKDDLTTLSQRSSSTSVRKYPTVDTNIPGAGTRRSSVNQVKTRSSQSSRASFRPMSSSRALSRRHNSSNNHPLVAQHIYAEAKQVWAWSKAHLPVAPVFMNLAEGIVCGVAPQETLEELDRQVATPFVAALDEHVVGPVVRSVCHIWQGLWFVSHDNEKNDASKSNNTEQDA